MNLYTNLAYLYLDDEDKFQEKGVTKFIKENMIKTPNKSKIFHIDCPYTKKKICRCKLHLSSLMPEKEKQQFSNLSEFLELEYKGKSRSFYEKVNEKHSMLMEKIQHAHNLSDIEFYKNYFNEEKQQVFDAAQGIDGSQATKKRKTQVESEQTQANMLNSQQQDTQAKSTPQGQSMLPEKKKRGRKPKSLKVGEGEDSDNGCYFENCTRGKETEDLLTCESCRRTFHAKCCSPPLSKAIVKRYPWQCFECKICYQCKSKEHENKMIICDICDRAFHSDCLKPKLSKIPEGDWYCNDCKLCKGCKESLQKDKSFPDIEHLLWKDQFFACNMCTIMYDNDEYCPICLEIVEEEEEGDYVQCDSCNLWVHATCENIPVKKLHAMAKSSYKCSVCRSMDNK